MSPYASLALGGAPQRSGEWRPDQPDRRRRTRRLGGSYEVGRNGTKIELTIDADSIDTGNPKRDEHLRSSDFFDVGDHAQVHALVPVLDLAELVNRKVHYGLVLGRRTSNGVAPNTPSLALILGREEDPRVSGCQPRRLVRPSAAGDSFGATGSGSGW